MKHVAADAIKVDGGVMRVPTPGSAPDRSIRLCRQAEPNRRVTLSGVTVGHTIPTDVFRRAGVLYRGSLTGVGLDPTPRG
jgi:hypothetical protein